MRECAKWIRGAYRSDTGHGIYTHMSKHQSVHSKVNITCDKEAEAGHIIFHGKQSNNPILPNEVGAVLKVGGQDIFRRMKEKIHYAAHASEMLGYLENFEWRELLHIIDWEAHKKFI